MVYAINIRLFGITERVADLRTAAVWKLYTKLKGQAIRDRIA